MSSNLTPESRISIGLLAGILGVSITATSGGAFWVSKVNARLEAIEEALRRPVPDRWTGSDMRVWVEQLRSEIRAVHADLMIPEAVHRGE